MKRVTLGREMFHISAVIDGSILHQMMSLCDGKAIDLKVVAVKTPEQMVAATMTAAQFIQHYSSDKTEFTMSQLQEAGAAVGIPKQSLYASSSKAVKDRILRRVSSGVFAPIRLLTGPKVATPTPDTKKEKKEQSAAQQARSKVRYEISNKEIALKFFKRHKKVTTAELIEHFEKEKRPGKSASPIISKLKIDGAIEMIEGSDPLKPAYRLKQGSNGHATV